MGEVKSDAQLLRDYVEHGNEAAFREIVVRHTDLIYSSALRQVGSPDVARDVTQRVFCDLARKAASLAGKLGEETSLAGWLYRGARFESLNFHRDDRRRQSRERQAMEQLRTTSEEAPDWDRLRPVLDEAMADLNDADREALLLRFFKNQDLRAVGVALGVSDDAAQKRVSRALEKLRESLSRRGMTAATGALTLVIGANAIHAAPVGLATTISTAALVGTAIHASTSIAATKVIAMTTLQKNLIAAVLVAAVGAGLYETRQASKLRSELHTAQQQRGPLIAQIDRLSRERDDSNARQMALQQENEQLRQAAAEVPRLRGEVARLRATEQRSASKTAAVDMNDPAMQHFLAMKTKADEITRYLEQMPEKKIPELKLLNDVDWLSVTREAKLDTDVDVRKTLSQLRSLAKNRLPMGRVLNEFARANNGQLPTDLAQLKPYINAALGDAPLSDATLNAIFERYTLLRTGNVSDLPPNAWIIAEKAPVDKDYDSRAKFGNGTSTIIGTGLHSAGDPDDKSY